MKAVDRLYFAFWVDDETDTLRPMHTLDPFVDREKAVYTLKGIQRFSKLNYVLIGVDVMFYEEVYR